MILLARLPTGRSARGKSKSNTYVPYAHMRDLHRQKVADRLLNLKKLNETLQTQEIARLNLIQEIWSRVRVTSGAARQVQTRAAAPVARRRARSLQGVHQSARERLTWIRCRCPGLRRATCATCVETILPCYTLATGALRSNGTIGCRCTTANRHTVFQVAIRRWCHGMPRSTRWRRPSGSTFTASYGGGANDLLSRTVHASVARRLYLLLFCI